MYVRVCVCVWGGACVGVLVCTSRMCLYVLAFVCVCVGFQGKVRVEGDSARARVNVCLLCVSVC